MYECEQVTGKITPREKQILQMVAAGATHQEIALELGISRQTVKNHMTNLLRNLGLRSSFQAVLWGIRNSKIVVDGIRSDREYAALLQACRGLVEYRNRVGPLAFQLAKADDFIRRIEVLLDRRSEEEIHADGYDEVRAAMADLHPGVEVTIQELGKNVAPGVFKTWHEAG